MKRYLIFLSALLGLSVGCQAASPSFSSFYTNHFTTNNLIIKANLNPLQFDTNASTLTITITNVSTAIGGSKWSNHIDNILRVIEGFGDNGIETTNHYVYRLLNNEGGMVLNGVLSSNLVAGVNAINPYEVNILRLVGSSPTPTDSTVSLSGAHGPGQILTVENYTANLGFCITNNTPLWDDPSNRIILPNGDWCPTAEGEKIWLQQNGHGNWVEILRVILSGPGFAIINPTDTYVPVRESAGVFADSGLRAPSAGSSELITVNTLTVGTNVGATFVPFRISAPVGHTNWIAHMNSGGTNWLHIDNQGRIGIGRTNVFINKDIGIYRAFDQDGNKPAWINIGAGDSWPFNYASEWWAKTGTNDGVMQLSWLTAGASTAYDHQFTVGSTAGLHRYKTLSNNVTTFQLNGDSGIIQQADAIYFGPNSYNYWGPTDYTIISIQDMDNGDPNNNGIAVWTVDGVINGAIDGNVTTNIAVLSVGVANGNVGSSVVWTGAQTNLFLDGQFGTNNPSVFRLHPTVEDVSANAAYTFDTPPWQTKASADLGRFKNAGTNMVAFATTNGVGMVKYGPGNTNVVYKDGLNLIYESSPVVGNTVAIGARRSSSTAYFGVNSAGGAFVQSAANRAILDVGGTQAFWDGTNFQPADANKNLGTATSPWLSLYVAAGGGSGVFIRAGTGDPTGVVTANVGSLWLRTDGGAGSTLYVKESATDATGWVAK